MAIDARRLAVEGAYIVKFPRHKDDRGFLQELFNADKYPDEITQHFPIKQITFSTSRQHVIRGLHVSPYAKLLTCVRGQVYDVVVDVRPDSPTYLKWSAVILTEDNCRQLLVPPNCGHGYYALTENATVIYGQGDTFKPGVDWGFQPLDKVVNIYWPVPEGVSTVMSGKDRDAAELSVSGTIKPRRIRVLVIGASGQVGGAICEMFRQYEAAYQVYGTSQSADINNYVQFDLEKGAKDESYVVELFTMCRPSVVIICAAFTNVDQCETNPEMGRTLNVDAVRVIGQVAARNGAKVVNFSTDYVFTDPTATDKQVVLNEDTATCPANIYGQLKLEGEVITEICPGSLVLRVSRVYGPEFHGKNFVYRTISCLSEKKPLYCLHSEVSCATYNKDIAKATVELINKGSSGVFHCVGPEPLSKYDWAVQIADYFGLSKETIVGIEEVDQGAKRPKYVPLNTEKLRQELPGFEFHTLQDAFKDWKENCSFGKTVQWPN